jgi:ubiquinone/menaquinone biosynthesis C-methylase UbiE
MRKQALSMKTYDDIAEWYDQWLGTHRMSEDPYFPAVEALLGEISGQRICDLACGQGRVARHLASCGAVVVGIDSSAKLLAIARGHEESDPLGITYVLGDAQRLDESVLGQFDGVLCFMALMDIPELIPTIQGVARILRPGGWFIFSILHPCFHTSQSGELETPEGAARTIRHYFEEGYWRSDTRTGPPGRVGAYHRTLSTYINSLTEAGFQVIRACEPGAGSQVVNSPSHAGSSRPVWHEVPAILVMSCQKAYQR